MEFTGTRGGDAPLTWGQQAFWRLTRWGLATATPTSIFLGSLPVYGRTKKTAPADIPGVAVRVIEYSVCAENEADQAAPG